ncbi:MAG TPA: metal-dependent hydrolase [Agriterribacter sp.]|nr:metal-dependent hydrolase [Agriterribacter sp.]
MDSLTHIAVGACVGEAFFGKGFGKKAMLWGALAQSIPDIDFIGALWLTPSENLLAHRGFTHSILFALLIAPTMAFTASRIHHPHNIRFRKWLIFFAAEVFLHLFLDGFNNYGVGWLVPFNLHRFSFNTIYVADPFFSIWAGIATVMLFILHSYHPTRRFWWRFGVFIPLLYFGYCCMHKLNINHDVKEILSRQQVPYNRYFTTPTPLNNWLWYVVADSDSGYYVGFRSVFDRKKQIAFQYFPRNDYLLKPMAEQQEVKNLLRFSQGFYTAEQCGDTLVFNDLRFGQVAGWQNPKEKFVFHYVLNYPVDNVLVVQRGRFSGWTGPAFEAFIERIKGN